MGIIKDQGGDVYRDFVTAGVPASGPNEPVKSEIRALFSAVDLAVGAAQAGIAIVSNITDRDSFYTTEANRGKLVYVNNNNGSATDPANGVYEYVSGAPRIAQSFYEGLATVVQPLVNLAEAYANADTDTDIPGADAGDRGAKFWAGEAADTVAGLTIGGDVLDPRDYELWTALEGAVRLVITSDNYLVLLDSFLDTDSPSGNGESLSDIMARPGPLIAGHDIAAVGDSFAEQQLAEETAKAYDILRGNPVGTTKPYNLGYSSHTIHAAATRINAFAANYRPASGYIPAGTDPYELIPENSELRAGPVQIFSGGSEGGRAPVYYGRVEQEFYYEGGKPMAQRKSAGKAISISAFTPLVCIPYAKNLAVKTVVDFWRDITVLINAGRNNVNGYPLARLVAEDTVVVTAILAAIRPHGWRPVLFPIWPNRAPGSGIDEPLGSDGRAKVDAINANRRAMWPDLYCDTLTPAINGYDVAAGDRVDDFNKGYTARSYRLAYAGDGVTVYEDTLHAGNYVTPGRKSGQQLEGSLAAQFLNSRYS